MRIGLTRGTRHRALAGLLAGLLAATLAPMVAFPASPATAHPGIPSSLFDPKQVEWYFDRELSLTEFSQLVLDKQAEGYLLVDLEADLTATGLRYGAAFQRNLDGRSWLAKAMMTGPVFDAYHSRQVGAGKRLVDFETFERSGERYYAAIWVRNVEAFHASFTYDLTATEAQDYYLQMKEEGYLPVDVNLYPTAGGSRYAMAWVENAGGLDWHLRAGIPLAAFGDKLISKQILSGQTLHEMWLDPLVSDGWGYAYGWSIDFANGSLRVSKNGEATGANAYLEMYPSLGITVAVTMNRRDPFDNQVRAQVLGQHIGSQILATLP